MFTAGLSYADQQNHSEWRGPSLQHPPSQSTFKYHTQSRSITPASLSNSHSRAHSSPNLLAISHSLTFPHTPRGARCRQLVYGPSTPMNAHKQVSLRTPEWVTSAH